MAWMTNHRKRRLGTICGGIALTLAGLQGCDSSDKAGSSMDENAPSNTNGNGASNGGTDGLGVGTGANPNIAIGGTPPNETEVNVDLEAPQASVSYVYATNPDFDTVAVIDAKTLEIQIVETGDEPRFLKTIPFKDAALLVDVAAKDIAYLETKDGKSTIKYFTKLPAANAIAVAPDGKHAVAYFDVTRRNQGTIETLQDVTVLSINDAEPVATRMTIGFQPRQVLFAGGEAGSAAAYIVTDDGVSILDFTKIDADGSSIAKTVPIFSAIEQKAADVSVTKDGKYALGRIEGSSQLRLVELATGTAQTLDLASLLPGNSGNGTSAGGASSTTVTTEVGGTTSAGGSTSSTGVTSSGGATASGGTSAKTSSSAATVTDVDLSADGTYALAVSRDRSTLLRVPIPSGFNDLTKISKTKIEGVTVGSTSISPSGRWAVLYTVLASEERVVIVDLNNEFEPRPVDLTKAVQGVTFSTSGEQAFVVHQKKEGSSTESSISNEEFIDRSYGYSLVDLKTGFRKLMITETAPLQTMTIPGKPYVFLTFSNDNYRVQKVNTDSLIDEWLDLGTRPVSMGVVASAERVFVNQDHPEGRMTFIDWETMATRSVTGYELNSMIRE
jgi:hypothetical protein